MSDKCTQCSYKDQVIRQQQEQIVRLENKIKRAQAGADSIVQDSNAAMAQHQPRGRWAYLRGVKEAAVVVRQMLE